MTEAEKSAPLMAKADKDIKHIQIKFNPDGVIAPALIAMKHNSEIIAISLGALEDVDLDNPPGIPGAIFSLQFEGPQESLAERKTAYTNWLLSKGFQDIARGIRRSLEEAFLYVELIDTSFEKTTYGELQNRIRDLREQANRMNFPELLKSVSQSLNERLEFEEEFLSLQKVRNCLEHRNGIVTNKDANHEGKALRLILPRIRMYSEKNGKEVEVYRNMRVEAGQEIHIRRDCKERIYQLGERVSFDAVEFYEIAFACFFFASDLAKKLPRLEKLPS